MNVELVKSTEKGFGRGERAIMVDGVRWGRTIVTYHGVWGTKHVFRQEHGEVLIEDGSAKYPREISIRSQRVSRFHPDSNWKPTETRVLDKARELIEAGRLRHPDAVLAEQKENARIWREARAKREAAEEQKFRTKACEALRINDPTSEIVDRVVAAMRWAQTQ